jgi:hypothetical protein
MNIWRDANPRIKAFGLVLLVSALAGLTLALPRIPQPLEYHQFADQRSCFGLPNCLDTASNALSVLMGVLGLCFLYGFSRRCDFIDSREALPYVLFFFAVILVGFASGFYHLAPDNGRLVWDRAAIALALLALLSAIFCERLGSIAGLRLLPLLSAAGLGSVAYWYLSEAHGRGDLRPYGLMQFTSMLLLPLLLWLYPPRYSGDRDILAVIGLYGLALLCDLGDRPIFALTGGLVSGHTLKHLVVGLAVYWVVRRLKRRRILRGLRETSPCKAACGGPPA